ncbi:uncharacterized protein [Onthophagus taurus]|nr:uncharacterized protein LOC111425527 [Onthophagus taurus]XP_022915385.1 uncharacterized protein LOC111425527 [Onthophagus taurus]XP_022915386.1 uncharacterized protein LOC111425527 [Onthophagus taurus]
MPKKIRVAKIPVSSPWLEKWSRCQTDVRVPEACLQQTPPTIKYKKDVGTQTPPSLLYMAFAEETKKEVDRLTPPSGGRRNSATDWMQMGCDLRHIADGLRLSNESLNTSSSSTNASQTSNISSTSSYFYIPNLVHHYQRRRSLPDASTWMLRRP